jgi:hypothetical protein
MKNKNNNNGFLSHLGSTVNPAYFLPVMVVVVVGVAL